MISKNKRGVSTEVLKIASAMLIALVVFVLLMTFALGPKAADNHLEKTGEALLQAIENVSAEIENYGT